MAKKIKIGKKMSLLRDTKYVKTLSKLTDSGDVMDDACRMILSDVELKLRVLINVRFPNFN